MPLHDEKSIAKVSAQTERLETLVTASEAASFLRVSCATLRRWRQKGYGPAAVKLGAGLRYDLEQLRAFALTGVSPSPEVPVDG